MFAPEEFSLAHLHGAASASSGAKAVKRLGDMREAKRNSQNSPEKARIGFLNGAIGGAAARH